MLSGSYKKIKELLKLSVDNIKHQTHVCSFAEFASELAVLSCDALVGNRIKSPELAYTAFLDSLVEVWQQRKTFETVFSKDLF